MSATTVRPARREDFPAVARLTAAAYLADGQLTLGDPYESTLTDVAARAAAGDLLVAEDEGSGAVMGAVLFVLPGSRYAGLARPGDGEFRMLAVDPAAQRRGVGEALVHACVDLAIGYGCGAVVISTLAVAAAAQRLYQRLGFRRTPERDWSPVPGVRLLALRMDLSPPGGPG